MKCLSLLQPWASLIVLGLKKLETRSWRTAYRGVLYIHASARFPNEHVDLCFADPHFTALSRALEIKDTGQTLQSHPRLWRELLPTGAVIGRVNLVECLSTEEALRSGISDDEQAFGDFSAGRYAFRLGDPVALKTPVPAKGKLNIWEFHPPEGWKP